MMTQAQVNDTAGGFEPPEKNASSLVRILVVVAVVLCVFFVVLLALVIPAVWQKNSAEGRQERQNVGRELASAVIRHQKTFRRLPINRVDDKGTEIQSWRVELLHFLGEQRVVDCISPTAAWDSDEHARVGEEIATKTSLPVFQSPIGGTPFPSVAHFVAVTDPGSPMSDEGKSIDSIKKRDGVNGTALFLEYPSSDIHWAEPRDITLNRAIEMIQSSEDSFGTVVVMANGQAIVVPKTATEEDLRKLFLLDNGVPQGSWLTVKN